MHFQFSLIPKDSSIQSFLCLTINSKKHFYVHLIYTSPFINLYCHNSLSFPLKILKNCIFSHKLSKESQISLQCLSLVYSQSKRMEKQIFRNCRAFSDCKNTNTSLQKSNKFELQQVLIAKKYFVHFPLLTIMNLSDSLILQRTKIVQVILTSKKVTALFSRDLQYLAIAIVDKFFSVLSKTESLSNPQINQSYLPISALLIAHKFGKNDSPGLKKILGLLKKGQENKEPYKTQKMVKTEEQILQTINFQIPQTTCYVELQNFINSCCSHENQIQLHIRTAMKLLKEITLASSQVSEYPEVGKQNYELVERKRPSQRAKRLYKMVIFSMRQRNEQKVETQD